MVIEKFLLDNTYIGRDTATGKIMIRTNFKGKNIVRDAFSANLGKCENVYIAAGYFGKSEIDRQQRFLIEKAQKGGRVILLVGLASSEGITAQLKSTLLDLHQLLRKFSAENGIYISESRYHGKLYITDGVSFRRVMIGSSNLSSTGFESNIELNIDSDDPATFHSAKRFFDELLEQSHPIHLCDIPVKSRSGSHIPTLQVSNISAPRPTHHHDFEIPLRVQPRSSLNLFLSRGRLNTKTGVYTPRPYYEVEITLPRESWISPLTHHVPDSLDPVIYQVVCDTGESFEVNFKRKTSSRSDNRSLHRTGGDFMSSPREMLGRYIKGKLMRAGVLAFGEPVSDDTLAEYGALALRVWDLGSGSLYIEF